MALIQLIRNASLDDGIGLTGAPLERLQNPLKKVLDINDVEYNQSVGAYLVDYISL